MSKRTETATQANNFKAVYATIFFDVPNCGMDISSLVPMAGEQTNKRLL